MPGPEGTILEQAARIQEHFVPLLEHTLDATTAVQDAPFPQLRNELGYGDYPVATPEEYDELVDTRIVDKTPLITPRMIEGELPLSSKAAQTVIPARKTAADILHGRNDRLMVIAGPCSVHDPEELLEYASALNEYRQQYRDDLDIIIRLYLEKARTEMGWPGFLYDPNLDQTYDINLGIIASRLLTQRVAEMGLPAATERLHPKSTPQFFNGLFTYDAIGARNITDTAARHYASGTSSVVGMKNPLDGNIVTVAEAIKVANGAHAFGGPDMNGTQTRVRTKGNSNAHLILRGGGGRTNYSSVDIREAQAVLRGKGVLDSVVVDCSHGNSGKDPNRQPEVAEDIARQLSFGQRAIVGVMIESYIHSGRQPVGPRHTLERGVSVTDGCVNIAETTLMLDMLAEGVRRRRLAGWPR